MQQQHKITRSFTFKMVMTSFLIQSALVTTTRAGGLYLNEFGTPSMGTAGAGSPAWGDDASTAFHNPAGMTRIEGRELMLTGGLVYSKVKFDTSFIAPAVGGGDGGDAGGVAPLGGLFYTQSLSERVSFGFDVFSIAGAVVDYEDNWAGRFLVQDVSLLTAMFNPSLAYKVNDKLSAAVGFGAMYGAMEMELAFPALLGGPGQAKLDGDDWAYGYNLGIMYELSERTRLGAVYWSEIEFELSGDVEVSGVGTVGSDTTIPLAQWIKCGIYHELNKKWALVGTIGWEDWSTLDNLVISTENGGRKVPRNWHDTYHYAGGVHYRPNEKWLLQAGISYDTSPVDSDDRTPDLPVDRQVRFALGAQYEWSKSLTLGAAFEYADMGDAEINRPLFKGEYEDNRIYFMGVYANWKF